MINNNETPLQSPDLSEFDRDNPNQSFHSAIQLRTPQGNLNNLQHKPRVITTYNLAQDHRDVSMRNHSRKEHFQRHDPTTYRDVDYSFSSIHSNFVKEGKTVEKDAIALEYRATNLINLANLFHLSELPPGTGIPNLLAESSSLRDSAQKLRQSAVNLPRDKQPAHCGLSHGLLDSSQRTA